GLAVAEGTDGALVRDHFATLVRDALTLDARIRRNGDRLGAEVGDRVRDGEQVFVVDRDHTAEAQAAAVVPGQFHRRGRGQLVTLDQRPDRIGARYAARNVGTAPAELGEIGVLCALRTEQLDRSRIAQLFAVLGQV